MKSIFNYIRSEWMYWVGAFIVLFALSALNAVLDQESAKSESSPVGFSQSPKD